jgi:hypothetical protein
MGFFSCGVLRIFTETGEITSLGVFSDASFPALKMRLHVSNSYQRTCYLAGHPSKYYLVLTLLDFGDQMGQIPFSLMVWHNSHLYQVRTCSRNYKSSSSHFSTHFRIFSLFNYVVISAESF